MPGGSACRMSSARRWEPVEARPILCQAHLGPEGQVWVDKGVWHSSGRVMHHWDLCGKLLLRWKGPYQPTGPDIPHELEAFINVARAVPAGSQVGRPGAGRP
jgi:hypothetical protein